MVPPKRSKLTRTSSRITDSLIVTLHSRSFARRLDDGGSLVAESPEKVSEDIVDSSAVLSRLDLLNCRKCDVHCEARRGTDGERAEFRDISP